MTMPNTSLPAVDPELRARLAGVRALLLDLDGVLMLRGEPIAGAAEALAALAAGGIPYVLATNVSLQSRATLARGLTARGLPFEADQIVSAAFTAAAYARRRFGAEPLYVMAVPDALAEFDGLTLLSHDDAARPDAHAAAVIVGDAGAGFTVRNMQSAFTLLHRGARFVAMHRNRWWTTPEGVTLDSGAYVAGLEYASQRRALVTGKPSRTFFAEGARRLAELEASRGLAASRDLVAAPLAPNEVAMVGDDLWSDVLGAQKAGLKGILVRSGKHGERELARFVGERAGQVPDAVAPSITEIAAALGGR
jgi:HAD superfamily hydrolase (TIGR01450 family)